MIYICRPCDAYVGVHRGTSNALGRLANKELRFWKKEAHAAFDPIWKAELNKGEPKHVVRNRVYAWLAKQLQIEVSETHIGFFDVDQCKAVVEVCKEHCSTGLPRRNMRPEYVAIKGSGFPDSPYKFFELEWSAKFREMYGNDFWYDPKKFCYTIDTYIEETKTQLTYDFYPKANKILFRQQNKWESAGLKWMAANLLSEQNSKFQFE